MADITYVLNDPTTPQLVVPVDLPPAPGVLEFKVDGYRGATDTMYTLEHQAACCHYTIVKAIELANRNLVVPVSRWALTQKLFVQPRAGKQMNAFYDRQALRFFYANDPVTQNMVYSVNSTDVVAHELGHAILDAVRPDLYNMQAMEIWGFHEAWGDIHAIMNLLQHDLVLETMLTETGGDLRKANTVTRLAEEMGTAIFNMTGGRMGHTSGLLRSVINGFMYTEPEKLPRSGPDNQLTCESHSFSRVFSGAWWDILAGIYETKKTALPPKEAVIAARDILTEYTYKAILYAPATIRFYDAMARSMLVIDKQHSYQYNQLMNDVFIARGILRQMVRPMVAMNWSVFKDMLEPTDEVTQHGNVVAVRSKKVETLPLPYYMMNVEAPGDTYYEFNGTGDCDSVVTASAEELVEHAHLCVEFLKEKDFIRPDKLAPFELDTEGNLIRSHFACNCSTENCKWQWAPEYGKCWKPENNAGCACNACKKSTSNPCNRTTPEPCVGGVAGQQTKIISRTTR